MLKKRRWSAEVLEVEMLMWWGQAYTAVGKLRSYTMVYMGSGRCALSASELMRRDAEDGGRRLEQGCRSVDAIVPAPNGHNGPWKCGFLQECMHNAAVTGVVVQPLFRHTRPVHGPSVR